jgi:hypothetical protein
MTARSDPPRRVTLEDLAFYKEKAERLRLAAQRRWRRRLWRRLAKLLRRCSQLATR